MILSYSLDVRQLPLDILLFFNFMFSYLNFIRLLKSLSRLTFDSRLKYENKIKNAPFSPKEERVWDKFCTRIRVIKLKKSYMI
jgi:hypothetical protein